MVPTFAPFLSHTLHTTFFVGLFNTSSEPVLHLLHNGSESFIHLLDKQFFPVSCLPFTCCCSKFHACHSSLLIVSVTCRRRSSSSPAPLHTSRVHPWIQRWRLSEYRPATLTWATRSQAVSIVAVWCQLKVKVECKFVAFNSLLHVRLK